MKPDGVYRVAVEEAVAVESGITGGLADALEVRVRRDTGILVRDLLGGHTDRVAHAGGDRDRAADEQQGDADPDARGDGAGYVGPSREPDQQRIRE